MVVVLSMTALLMFLSVDLWLKRDLVLSFESNAGRDVEYQVFYAHKSKKNFVENRSVKSIVKAGKNKIKISLPINKIVKFRLDFGSGKNNVEISHLELKGNRTFRFDDFSKFNFHDIKKHKIEGNKLILDLDNNDPYIVYEEPLKLKAKTDIDFYIFVILAMIYFLGSYKLIKYLSRFKFEENNSRIDIVFLSVFFALLFIPMSHISDAEKSIKENRMLTKKPSILQLWDKKVNFGRLYEQWFNDRFFGRDELIRINCYLKNYITKSGNNKVLVGKDGWLFYKGNDSLRNYQNLDLFKDDELEKVAKYLSSIDDWAKKNGKKFYFIICPDKNKIYGEYVGINKYIDDQYSRANQLIKYLKDNTKVKVVYPYDELHEAKKLGLLYWKNDTHWNELGAYVGYKKLADVIAKDFPVSIVKYDKLSETKHETGDLSKMFHKLKKDNDSRYDVPIFKNKAKCNASVDSREDTKCINNNLNYRVFVFRDSFTSSLAPYLNNTFGKVSYFWRRDIVADDLEKIKKDADIVILEVVERNICRLNNLEFPEE